MFQQTTYQVIEEIVGALQCVSKQALRAGIRMRRDYASNTLCMQAAGLHCIVSDFVVPQLATEVDKTSISAAYDQVCWCSNPVLEGIVLKLDYLFSVRQPVDSQDGVRNRIRASSQMLTPRTELESELDSFACPHILHFAIKNNSNIFLPNAANVGDFDMAQLLNEHMVRFVLVTHSATHDINVGCMITFLEKLNRSLAMDYRPQVTTMEIVVLVPYDDVWRCPKPNSWSTRGVPHNNQISVFDITGGRWRT